MSQTPPGSTLSNPASVAATPLHANTHETTPSGARETKQNIMLSRDTGIGPEDLGNAMLDRDLWKTVVANTHETTPSGARETKQNIMLSRDTGIGPEDLGNAMLDRDLWKTVVANIPAGGAEG